MPGIFKLNKENTIVLTPEAKDLCVTLSKLDDDNFMYVILVYDTMDSPYRRKPEQERRRIARNRIWGKDHPDMPEDNPLVADAIDEMKSIVYDHNKDDREVLLTKLTLLNADLMSSDSSRIKSIMEAIELIENRIDELDSRIDREEEIVYLKGGRKLSFVEMFIKNREAYIEKMKSYGIGN